MGDIRKQLGATLMPAVVSIFTITCTRWTFDFDKEEDVFQARVMFAVTQVCILALNIYIKMQASAASGPAAERSIKVPKDDPDKPFGDPMMVTSTVKDYDKEQAQTKINHQLIGGAILGAIHFYFNIGLPLVIQSVLAPYTAYKVRRKFTTKSRNVLGILRCSSRMHP